MLSTEYKFLLQILFSEWTLKQRNENFKKWKWNKALPYQTELNPWADQEN